MASAVIGALRVVLGIDTAMFDQGLADAMKSLKGIGKTMQDTGKSMSMFLTAPIAGFGALTVKTAGDFEAAMNRVEAASGATSGEFKAMRDMAIKLGADTSFSASESADAMEMLAKNGLKAGQILDGAVSASMKLAAASGSELSAAADVATDVMMNFGKEAKELGGLVDGITGVLLESKFSFDDYRLAIGQAGGVAGNLGVEFEDFNAALVATSSAFASGSDAGTSLKQFLVTLVPQSKKAAEAMEALNLSFFKSDGTMKNMTEIAEELKSKMSGLSDQALNQAMKDIFGVDAMRTAIMLMKQGGDGIEEIRSRLNNASADEQAAARLKGFNGELEKLSGAFETLQIAIADSGLLAMVTAFVTQLAGWVEALSQTNPELLQWGVIIAGLTAALGPLLLVLGTVATAIAAIGTPIAAVIAGVTALTAAIVAFWPEIQNLGTVINSTFISALNAMQAAWDAMIAKVAAAKQSFVEFAASIPGLFANLASQMMEIGAQIMDGLWQGIKGKFAEVRDGITNFASGLVDSVKSTLGIHSPSRVMHEIGTNIMQGLSDGMSSASGGATNGAVGVASSIANSFSGIGSSIGEAIKGTKKWSEVLKDVLGQLAKAALSKINIGGSSGGGGGFGGIVTGLLGSLLGFANGGSFMVGGSGGIDSQLVAFKASPNERVTVTKPGQEGGRASYAPVYHIDARGADQAAIARLERGLAERDRKFAQRVDHRVDTRQSRKTRG